MWYFLVRTDPNTTFLVVKELIVSQVAIRWSSLFN